MTRSNWLHEPLAIIGMDCRLPGADGLPQYWKLLLSGESAVGKLPEDRLDRRLYFDSAKGKRGKTYSEIGGIVQDRALDWSLLNIPAETQNDWDPCHLALCEVAARACHNAGFDPRSVPIKNTGVFIGHSGGTTLGGDLAFRCMVDDYLSLLEDLPQWTQVGSPELLAELSARLKDSRRSRQNGLPHVDASYASGLICRNFGFSGPHLSIDAACASSLVALAMSSLALASGQVDMAIVGGASYNKSDSLVLFSAAQSCSAGMSRPFDNAADGLIGSEGYVAVVVKRLERALADGDHIQAVIRGIGMSSDGRGKSLWAPRHEGQRVAIQRAYAPDVPPDSVQLIEAHATSTQLGDATEVSALANFYQSSLTSGQRLAMGSVKSNLGHTLETAGLAGLVKVVLAIQNGVIPPSINLKTPNQTIAWDDLPFYVPTESEPWPALPSGQPRRAAVNAFGIGGLNVHIVVDQATESMVATNAPSHSQAAIQSVNSVSDLSRVSSILSQRNTSRDTGRDEPIAVIGRGIIVPGANSLADFRQLLAGGTTAGQPTSNAAPFCHRVDFQYDWQKHKIPPKQIARANPLQFMLLEAAEQALREAGLHGEELDRLHTVVIVGSIFGGDFGNALFAGLRLPEIRDHLDSLLKANKTPATVRQQLVDAFESNFLERYPALLDETGSFTSSTLASRISKTFNLMGGALAIDAGDVSGLAALRAAALLLNSGSVSTAICATAQSALDRAAIENLQQCGRLPNSTANTGYEIGEGVAVLVLKTLSQAQQDGNSIYAILDSIDIKFSENNRASVLQSALTKAPESESDSAVTPISSVVGRQDIPALDLPVENLLRNPVGSKQAVPFRRSSNLGHTGHLQGAQGIVDIIACSLQDSARRTLVIAHAQSGQSALVDLTVPAKVGTAEPDNAKLQPHSTKQRNVLPQSNWLDSVGLQIGYWGANTLEELKIALREKSPRSLPAWLPNCPSHGDRFQATVVAAPEHVSRQALKLSSLIAPNIPRDALLDQGMYWLDREEYATSAPRVAFLFPGQGSQYPNMLRGMPDLFPSSARLLATADQSLAELGQLSFAQMVWSGQDQLGEDIWVTQSSLLVADILLFQAICDCGLKPEIVCGHSFGEIPALVAAGSLDLPTAIQLTWHRCQSVINFGFAGCGMLSIQKDAEQVSELLTQHRVNLTISHRNSPMQTVVGGLLAELDRFEKILSDSGVISRRPSVPTAFHTPALAQAVQPFFQSLREIPLKIPTRTFLSSVNNRFMADPDLLRTSLADQLTTPVHFGHLLKRLAEVGVTHVVEVGPHNVLTRLARSNHPAMHVFCADSGPRQQSGPDRWISLASLQMFCHLHGLNAGQPSGINAQATSSQPTKLILPPHVSVKHFDATVRRRQRMKQLSERSVMTTDIANVHVAELLTSNFAKSPQNAFGKKCGELPKKVDSELSVTHFASESTRPLETLVVTAKSKQEIEQLLIDFVVEQTGYPAEIVDLHADMEADLGIDSIKKAQLLGELRELFPESVAKIKAASSGAAHPGTPASTQLDRFRTLSDFVQIFSSTISDVQQVTSKQIAVKSADPEAREDRSIAQQQPIELVGKPLRTASREIDRDRIEQFLIDFVIEHTGYPREIVELDAEIEADLGIDSIKKAQLLGELRETFSIDTRSKLSSATTGQGTGKSLNLDSLRTLRHILNILYDQEAGSPEAPQSNDVHTKKQTYELPVLSKDGDIGFSAAVKKNLSVLSSRVPSKITANTASNWWNPSALVLAKKLSVPIEAIMEFSDLCLRESQWHCMPRHDASDAAMQCWFLALRLPRLLTECAAQPIGVVRSAEDGALQIGVPGCAVPLAMVNRENLLLAAGSNNLANQQTMAARLEELVTLNNDAIRTRINQWTDLTEGWLIVVDPKLERFLRFEIKERGVSEQDHDLRFWSGDLIGTGAEWVYIGIDLQRQEWLVGVKDGSSLAVPQVAPLPSLDWEADLQEQLQYYSGFSPPHIDPPTKVAQRFILRMVESPQVELQQYEPEWAGAAVVVGDNPIATALVERLEGSNVKVLQLVPDPKQSERAMAEQFNAACGMDCFPHLFITTPCDLTAQMSLQESGWEQRSRVGIMGIFWLCQSWLQHVTGERLVNDASLVAVSSLGGDFGLSGRVYSAEGGGINGLLKSMLIENWMQGHRSLAIKTIDTCPEQTPDSIVDGVFRELAVPSYDNEISYSTGIRKVLRAVPSTVPQHRSQKPSASSSIRAGGTWICTGGARGITAYCVERLAQRYGLTVQLLGTTQAAPEVDNCVDNFVNNYLDNSGDSDPSELRKLKLQVMTDARACGKNPVKAWQTVEKQMEIAQTLRRFEKLGITASYHACDIADRNQLRQVLQTIRNQSGPIQGVLHGAGVGRDARFDRKQPEHVRQCLAAKVDGTLALMAETWNDPLQAFIGFGSISGRFGANGHTDYSLSNEMLCKQIDWFKHQRPDVRAVGFHWHAWGDVGMATKPETRLALEMIDMQLLPAEEGVEHLINELESDSQESEVLITDDRYYRAFYPAETLSSSVVVATATDIETPLILRTPNADNGTVGSTWVAKVDPTKDPFLTEHLLEHRPLLPFVVAAELLYEAASAELNSRQVVLSDIQALRPVKFFSDVPTELRLRCCPDSEGNSVTVELYSDVTARSGRMIEQNRLCFRANASPTLSVESRAEQGSGSVYLRPSPGSAWQSADYPDQGSEFYVGWPLQKLKKYCLMDAGLIGKISAPAIVELAGVTRNSSGWAIPSAALDACLFATGLLAWHRVAPGTALPISFGSLRLGRLPAAGEACQVHVAIRSSTEQSATFDFSLYGIDGSLILDVKDYRIAWLGRSSQPLIAQQANHLESR